MIARVAKALNEKEKGFTLIELLVVVVIIGILAAIAIPAFLRQRENAWKAAVESDLKNASIAAESYATTKNGTYEAITLDLLEDNGYNATADVTVTPAAKNEGKEYTLTAVHDKLDGSWVYDSATGTITAGSAPAGPSDPEDG